MLVRNDNDRRRNEWADILSRGPYESRIRGKHGDAELISCSEDDEIVGAHTTCFRSLEAS